jgi:uncharacterized protein YbaP (TraB family)
MKRTSLALIHCVLAVVLLTLGTAAAAERLYMWEAKGRGGTAYLYGSVHLCRADCFPLPDAVVKAADAAPALALELDPERPGLQEQLLKRALYPAGETLQRDLSPQLIADLQAALARAGIPPEPLMHMRPWMVGTTLTALAAVQAGYDAQQGIDLWLLKRARSQAKPVIELETADEQLASLDGLPREQQEQMVRQAVTLVGDGSLAGFVGEMVDAWRKGDPDRLYKLSRKGLDSEAQAERLLSALVSERNGKMANRIADAVAQKGGVFAVVGALHLAGADSVQERLKAKGFAVRQVQSPY